MNGDDLSGIKKQYMDFLNLLSKVTTEESVGDEITEDGIIRNTEEKTTIDGSGLTIGISNQVRFAGCNHVVKSVDDIGGKCYKCSTVVCKSCISACMDCGKGICRKHRFVTEKGEIYCSSCKWKYFFKKFMGFK